MSRVGHTFIVLCMVLIAACAGAVVYLLAGFSGAEATVVSIAALTGLAVFDLVATRTHRQPDLDAQIADLAAEVTSLNRRMTIMEDRARRNADGVEAAARTIATPIADELDELSALVKQLAETVAYQETEAAHATAFDTTPDVASPSEGVRTTGGAPFEPPAAPANDPRPAAGTIESVREAVDANRIDLYLQSIVTLPQRKVRYYEGLTRLRTESGSVIEPPEFLEAAEACGLMATIDTMLLLRSRQVVRRLQIKNRETCVFCNIATSTLNDAVVFPELLQFLNANKTLAPSLVLEFAQHALRDMGPMELESLAALRELGFHFCMDRITDLRIEPRDLAARGIRYVKISAPLLLGAAEAPHSDIHAADLSSLLARFGITLIVDRIEREAQVVELLEYGVRFGQGFLFSSPRPVRLDTAHDATAAPDRPERDRPDARRRVAAGGSARSF
ncbi:MAG TPA: EAL domain-containing protein [Xanthobacteraceae bacterium]|nr:EAL domain-containing protein [Xanthobacteraceae bacterium]